MNSKYQPGLSVKIIFICCAILILSPRIVSAFDKIITVPAENPAGITVDLEKGDYVAEIAGGAITLFYPINPHYCWLVGIAVGTDVKGAQDEPNIGTLYFEPDPPVNTQAEAEQQLLSAIRNDAEGTSLRFSLKDDERVRFWVSDFDYTDNSGMVKLRVHSQ